MYYWKAAYVRETLIKEINLHFCGGPMTRVTRVMVNRGRVKGGGGEGGGETAWKEK